MYIKENQPLYTLFYQQLNLHHLKKPTQIDVIYRNRIETKIDDNGKKIFSLGNKQTTLVLHNFPLKLKIKVKSS